ncbi:palmitoyltransferase [Thraustotheca clavata]|uniref:Palmitoyltransferase n=1 Tax=Thraustotheca clavata TaxID=74557 RepID=A0A1V9Z8Q8_9STRA|nr:palmitoyltransferase [Thraustotheca clavata]
MVIDAILTAFMVVSYTCAIFITPSLSVQAHLASSEDNATTENEARFCEKCDAIKPEDFHHCSVCGRCISHMDHHCPWTSNCVGLRTKKVFILFLFYTSISCLWSGALLINSKHSIFVSIITALSFGIGNLLGGYFVFHLYLLWQGKTTLDFMAGRSGNKLGFVANFRVNFGHEWWLYPFPILPPSIRHGQLMRSDDECAKLHGDII